MLIFRKTIVLVQHLSRPFVTCGLNSHLKRVTIPDAVLIYIYIYIYMCVCVCVCVCKFCVRQFRDGNSSFLQHRVTYLLNCTGLLHRS